MRETFSDCGPIKTINWQTDKVTGDFKGYYCTYKFPAFYKTRFAFIEFVDQNGASAAVAMNGTSVFGRTIKIQHSTNKTGQRGPGGPGGGRPPPSGGQEDRGPRPPRGFFA